MTNRSDPGPWPVLTYINATSTLQQYFNNNRTTADGYFEVSFLPVTQIYPDHIIVDATRIKAMGCEATVTASLSLDAQSPYWISQNNFFIVVSCNAEGTVSGRSPDVDFSTSCGPIPCLNSLVAPYCNVYDCCIQTIGLTKEVTMSGRGIGFAEFPNCGYSTLLYPSTFSVPGRGYAQGPGVGDGTYGVSLWYEIQRNATVTNCAEAAKDQDKFECSNNARCHDKTGGYICQCQTQGYEGDGYTLGTGCKGKLGLIICSCIYNCDFCPSCSRSFASLKV